MFITVYTVNCTDNLTPNNSSYDEDKANIIVESKSIPFQTVSMEGL